MAYTVHQRFSGRRPSDGDRPANEVPYLILGDDPETDDSEEEARAALRAGAAATLDGLKLLGVRIEERELAGRFVGTASYGTGNESGQKETGESSFQFDTSGATVKVTQSKATVGRYPAGGGGAPDLKGVIGATDEGPPDGVDLVVPQYNFSITKYFPVETVDDAYKGTLFNLTGKVNDAAFHGCAAGECLFLGARGSQRGRGAGELTFSFAASPNVTGLEIGDEDPIDKGGWEYIWFRYTSKVVGTGANKFVAPVPTAVYVERVYDSGDFTLLGL
jgi:hypothetical protein